MQIGFFKNLVYNNLSQGLQFGSRWVFNLVIIAILSDSDFGVFAYVLALSNILMAVFPFGSPIYMIGVINNENKKQELLDAIAAILSLFGIGLFIYLVLLPFDIKHYDLLFYGLVLGLIYSLNSIVYFYFKSLGKFAEEIKASFVSFALTLLFIGYLKIFNADIGIGWIFIVLIFLNLIVLVYLFIFSKLLSFTEIINGIVPSIKRAHIILSSRLYFGLQEMMMVAYSQVGLLVLFYFLANDDYGIYRKLFIIIAPVQLVSVAYSQVLLHHLKKYKNQDIISEFRKYQKITLIGAVIVMGILWISKSFLISVLGKLEITPEILEVFLILVLVVGIRLVYGNYEMLLVRLNKQYLRFWIMFVAAIVSLGGIFILVPNFGLMGAVLTNLSSGLIVVFGMLFYSEIAIKRNKPLKQSDQ